MVKLRSVFRLLLTSVLALLLGSGAVWALDTESALVPPQPEPELGSSSAQFVPATAPLMVSWDGNSNLLKTLGNEAATTSPQVTDWPAMLLATAGIDYHQDIRPWGNDEITLALTSLEQGQSGSQSGYLLVLKTRNNRDADAFLENLWQQQAAAGETIGFERYAGVDIISTQISALAQTSTARLPNLLQPIRSLSTAKVEGRFVLVANQSQVLQQAIDTVKRPQSRLSQQPDYQKAIATLTQKQQSGIAYLNLNQLIPALSGKTPTASPTYQSMGVAFGESRQGLLAETALIANSQRQLPAVQTNDLESTSALSYFPGTSPFVVSGSNLGALWSQINQDLQGYPGIRTWVNQTLEHWGQARGIDLTHKIFPWVDGEYAWALLPDSLSPVLATHPESGADWLFAYEQTHSDKSKQLAAHLNEAATQQDLGTSPFELAGKKVYAWTRLVSQEIGNQSSNLTFKTEVTGAYANIDNQKVLASSPEALGLALEAGTDALGNQRQFQDAIAPFEQTNQGLLYIDWPVMHPTLEQTLPGLSKLETNAPVLFEKLRSISLSSYGETSNVQHSQWYFRFS